VGIASRFAACKTVSQNKPSLSGNALHDTGLLLSCRMRYSLASDPLF
jgi:hypothetical protein